MASLKIATPSTCLLSGPSGSGKTQFIFRMLDNAAKLFEQPPESIFYCYTIWQQPFQEYQSRGIRFINGIPDLKMFEKSKNSLLILDDFLSQVKEKTTNQKVSDLFTRDSHHLGITVIFVVQNIFEPKIRTITLNSHYLILFNNPRDLGQISTLARQLFGPEWRFCVDAYMDATKKPFGYLFIDLHPLKKKRYRVRTLIMPDEQSYVYLPKNLYIAGACEGDDDLSDENGGES